MIDNNIKSASLLGEAELHRQVHERVQLPLVLVPRRPALRGADLLNRRLVPAFVWVSQLLLNNNTSDNHGCLE